MNEIFQQFMSTYGITILYSIITAVAGYIGIAIKNAYERFINDKTKQDVARTCVKAVEQIYKDLHGEEKLNKCVKTMSEMLNEKGIAISHIEIMMLIEAAVKEMNDKSGNVLNKE